MKRIIDGLASFGESWFMDRGWRRTVTIAATTIAYAAFNLAAFLLGSVEPFVFTLNFLLIVLAAATLGIWGSLITSTLTGFLFVVFADLFVFPRGLPSLSSWITGFFVFEVFGLVAGSVSGVFRHQIRAQRDSNDRFIQAQKMEAIGRLSGGIAHDFNNMLTAISGYAQLIGFKTIDNPEIGPLIGELLEAVNRSASLTHHLLAISRKGTMDPRPVNVEEDLRALAKMLRRIIGDNIELKLNLAEDSWKIQADPVHVDQVLMNLAVNAVDAMPEGGKLTIRTEKLTVDSVFATQHPDLKLGDYIMITVADTGTGIDKAVKTRVFEPFFTTKEVGKGTGLGLSTAYGIVKQMKGDIWFYSEPGHGTSFKICLPRAISQEHHDTKAALSTKPKPRAVDATILVAEDDEPVRKIVARLLADEGYTVLTANDGEEALKMIRDMKREIDILITDVMMPKVSGIQVIEEVYKLRPNIGVIVTSGYTREERDTIEITALADTFLEKPFTGDRLLSTVRGMLG